MSGLRRWNVLALITLNLVVSAGVSSARVDSIDPAPAPDTVAAPQLRPVGQPQPGTGRALAARRASSLATAKARREGVRRANGLSIQTMEAVVQDDTAYVDDNDQLFYIDAAVELDPTDAGLSAAPGHSAGSPQPAATDLPAPASPPDPLSTPAPAEAFSLHSRPGSTKTLFIDFDGATISGTYWNQSTGVSSKTVPPYDLDGYPGSFTTDELTVIVDIWRAVQEDYASFDVDVTTATPTAAQIERTSTGDNVYGTSVVVTGDNWICPGSCAGTAYLNSFGSVLNSLNVDQAKPAWAFTSPYFASVPAIVAGVISHEAGHTFGLSHDGTTTVSYYGGHGTWQPIMGSGSYYSRPVSQWSKGEYLNANNLEDDIAIIARTSPIVADDVPGTVTAPTGQLLSSFSGTIGTPTDQDTYQIDVGSLGRLKALLTTNAVSPNLDAVVEVRNAADVVVGTGNPPGVTGSVSVALQVPPGSYRVTVSSTSYLSPLDTGYSSYGSIGGYGLGLYLMWEPTPPRAVVTSVGDQSITASWQPPIDNGGGFDDYSSRLCEFNSVAGTWSCGAYRYTTSLTTTYEKVVPGRTYRVQVAARNVMGSSAEAVSANVVATRAPAAPVLNPLTVRDSAFNFSWTPVQVPDVVTTGYETSVADLSTATAVSKVVAATVTADEFGQPVPGHAYEIKVRALSSQLTSEWSSPKVFTFGRIIVRSAASPSTPERSAPVPSAPGEPVNSRVPAT